MTSTLFGPESQPRYQGEVVGVAFGRETKDGDWVSDGTYVTIKLDGDPGISPGRCEFAYTDNILRR